jgi:hypothetical protein
VTYTFEKKNNEVTKFTWTQKGFGTEEGYQHSLGGMKEFLQKIKEIAERK